MTQATPDPRPDDETLMAFADGCLDAEERARVARYLATDAEARALVAEFERTADLTRRAFEPIAELPPAKELVDRILDERGGVRSSNVVDLPRRGTTDRRLSARAIALAASVVLVLGLAVLHQLGLRLPRTEPELSVSIGPLPSGGRIAQMLETRPSNEVVTFSDDPKSERVDLMVVASFKDKSNRYCRELELVRGAPSASAVTFAIACRDTAGGWVIEGAARHAPPQDHGTSFTPAGHGASTAVEGILAELGAGPALANEEEAALLARGWRP